MHATIRPAIHQLAALLVAACTPLVRGEEGNPDYPDYFDEYANHWGDTFIIGQVGVLTSTMEGESVVAVLEPAGGYFHDEGSYSHGNYWHGNFGRLFTSEVSQGVLLRLGENGHLEFPTVTPGSSGTLSPPEHGLHINCGYWGSEGDRDNGAMVIGLGNNQYSFGTRGNSWALNADSAPPRDLNPRPK